MPNPYHDETGRFCSKEEMGQAVERLHAAITPAALGSPVQLNAATDAWFNLRSEYEAATFSEVTSEKFDERWLAPLRHEEIQLDSMNSALAAGPKSLEELQRKLAAADYLHGTPVGSVEHTPESAYTLYGRDRPQGLHAISKLDAQSKAKLLNYMFDHGGIGDDAAQAALSGSSGEDERVARVVISRSNLPVGMKLNLARRRKLLALFAARNPALVADEPAIEQELVQELSAKSERDWSADLELGWAVLAKHTKSQEVRDEVLDRYGYEAYEPRVLREFAQNPHLSASDNLAVYKTMADNDAAEWPTLAARMAGAARQRSGSGSASRAQELQRVQERYWQLIQAGDVGAYVPISDTDVKVAEEAIAFYNREAELLSATDIRDRANCYTLLDAQPAALAALREEYGAAQQTYSAQRNETNRRDAARIRNRIEAATRLRAAAIATVEFEAGDFA